jgi:glycosyltransferase involved in cell wall biosynthesis
MKTTIVALYEAVPPASGAAAVTYNLTKFLDGEKCLIQLTSGGSAPESVGGARVIGVRGPAGSGLSRAARVFPRLGEVAARAVEESPDVLILEGASWAPYFVSLLGRIRPAGGKPFVVYHSHNVEYLLRKESRGRLQAALTRRAEARLVRGADLATAVSEVDRGHFERLYGVSPFLLPNGVDAPAFDVATAEDAEAIRSRHDLDGPVVLFMGLAAYPPNAEAIGFLAGDVFPAVVRERPAAKLVVLGGPVSHREPWLVAPGHVSFRAIPAYLRASDVCVAPVFSGSGTRLKILEYMAAGRPVVATAKGAEGLDVRDGEDILLAETGEETAAKILDLLGNAGGAEALGRRGRELVRAKYDWRAIVREFERHLRSRRCRA